MALVQLITMVRINKVKKAKGLIAKDEPMATNLYQKLWW